jgi:two-component system response regulator YesN
MLRCVVLSGYDEFEFARRAMKMGVREYLLKPCTKQEMTAVLSRLCGDIRREQRCASERLDEREARTAGLAARLTALIPDERTRTVTGEQVLTTARAMDGEALLREAYIYLIAHSEAGAERGFEAIRQTYESNGELAEYIAKGLTRLHGQSGQYRAFVTQICAYIQTHYGDANLSLQYLADHVVHMRADYIGREFIQDTGMKLSTYLLRVRMERAKAMLTASVEEQHIYEIAERVGLGHNPQYFSQLFRKYTGLTPKEYGKNQTKNNGI